MELGNVKSCGFASCLPNTQLSVSLAITQSNHLQHSVLLTGRIPLWGVSISTHSLFGFFVLRVTVSNLIRLKRDDSRRLRELPNAIISHQNWEAVRVKAQICVHRPLHIYVHLIYSITNQTLHCKWCFSFQLKGFLCSFKNKQRYCPFTMCLQWAKKIEYIQSMAAEFLTYLAKLPKRCELCIHALQTHNDRISKVNESFHSRIWMLK